MRVILMTSKWERLQNGSRYDLVRTGVVTQEELKIYRDCDSKEEFEERVEQLNEDLARAEYEDRRRR